MVLSLPVAATETMICSDAGKASVSLLLGATDVISVLKVDVEAGGRTWSTEGQGDSRIVVGQAFGTADQMLVDLTDAAVNQVIVQLRLFKAAEGDAFVTAGTLRIADVGAFAVTCEGP